MFLHILEVYGWILCKTFEIVQSQAKVALTNWM